MLYRDFEADTEKEATLLALESLGCREEDVKIEYLGKRKKNFFGLGNKEKAKIRVFYKEKNDIDNIFETIKIIILKINNEASITFDKEENNRYYVKVNADNPGKLIGKGGSVINSIQFIINTILNRHGNKYKITLDINHYLKKKYSFMTNKAQTIAKKVARDKDSITINDLYNSYERRLIYLSLEKIKGIQANSMGTGEFKKITISPINAKSQA